MAEREDGGMAFPTFERDQEWDENAGRYRDHYIPTRGMTLRDYLAGQALIALMSNDAWVRGLDQATRAVGKFKPTLAENCYAMADAMLKVRKAGQ